MIDWAEGHHKMNALLKEFFKAMLDNNRAEARELCNQIVVEARLTKAMIQEKENV